MCVFILQNSKCRSAHRELKNMVTCVISHPCSYIFADMKGFGIICHYCVLSVFILIFSRRPRCQKHLHLRQLLPPRDVLKISAALLPHCQSPEAKLVASCRSSGRCAPTWMRSKAFYFILSIQCESTSVRGTDEFHRDGFLLF